MDMNQLMEGLKDMGGSRSMQKKLSKIPQQQIEAMLKKYGAAGESTSQPTRELTARERLRQKIREGELKRMGRAGQEQLRREEQVRLEKEREQQLAEPKLTDEEKAAKEKARMKRLKKKFKTVSEDSYFSALEQVQDLRPKEKELSNDDKLVLQRSQNMVDLYNYQHRNDKEEQVSEKELDLEIEEEE